MAPVNVRMGTLDGLHDIATDIDIPQLVFPCNVHEGIHFWMVELFYAVRRRALDDVDCDEAVIVPSYFPAPVDSGLHISVVCRPSVHEEMIIELSRRECTWN